MGRAPFCPARKRVDFNPRYVSIDTKCERPGVQPDVIRRLNRRDIASLMTYGTEDALCISSFFHSAYFSFQFLSSSFFLFSFFLFTCLRPVALFSFVLDDALGEIWIFEFRMQGWNRVTSIFFFFFKDYKYCLGVFFQTLIFRNVQNFGLKRPASVNVVNY